VFEKGILQNVRHNLRESFFKQALKCNTHFAEAGFLCIAKRVADHGTNRNGISSKAGCSARNQSSHGV